LGAIAILVPRFPRLKEWAYAGIFFDLTGAAASCAAVGGYGAYGFHVIAPLIITGFTVASWALRPESRSLGQREIAEMKPVLKAYIREAIEVEKSGVKVEIKEDFGSEVS
jgi:hypothetical protein